MAHDHDRDHRHSTSRLGAAVALTLGYALVEAAGGWWSGSLALLADAGHMASDGAVLGLAALAAWAARRPASTRHSFGLGRAEMFAALANSLLMLAVVVLLGYEALLRLSAPVAVRGGALSAVAAAGLAVNLLIARLLSRGARNMNTRGALLHVLGDILGSIAALAAGLVILATGWTPIDPLLSLFICALLVVASLRLLRDAVHGLMEGVPPELSLPEVGSALAALPGVVSVHDLHIWMLSGERASLSAHVVVEDLARWEHTLRALQQLAAERFRIEHVTLQPEPQRRVLRRIDAPR
ncbi:MAG TPA: cation diffusion facilitator family transporter [Burkholderiales bacterium]|nr:cation diffusion facilitator family transporter [Burkholderiales bacterium]